MSLIPLVQISQATSDPRVPVELNNEDWGYSTNDIQTAMQRHAEDYGWKPMVAPPVIRPVVGTSDEVLGSLVLAVDAMNAWLPYDQHIRIGEPVSQFNPDPAQVPAGEIHVKEATAPIPGRDPVTLGLARSWPTPDQNYWRAGTIQLTPRLQFESRELIFTTLLHEILHTMGLYGHLDQQLFPESIMNPTVEYPEYLPVVDGLTLLMGYTQLQPGSSAAEIATTDLGSWAENAPALAGSLDACTCHFWADLIGGHAVTWFDGEAPGMFVQDLGLTGTATWDGKMVGWTTGQEAVWSDMTLDVDLGSYDGISLDGQVEFNRIAFYPSGTQWGSGELAYDIGVSGGYPYFRSENTSVGYVFGTFHGPNLDGALGTLEHPELTGAFGGAR